MTTPEYIFFNFLKWITNFSDVLKVFTILVSPEKMHEKTKRNQIYF